MSLALLGLLLAAQISTSSTSTTTRSREEDIFGDEGDEEKKPPAAVDDERKSILPDESEEKAGVIDALEQTLGVNNDYLDIGGTFWLQLEYDALERGDPKTFHLRSPNFLDLYADARPVEHLRAFVQARLLYDFTVKAGATNPLTGQELKRLQMLLDQYWVKFDILDAVFITVGAERLRWGVGQIWQPTDFINAQRRDPTALFDLRLGVPVLKVHVPIESLGWNFYAVALLDEADEIQKVGGAFRAEFVLGPAELGLSGAVRKDAPQQLGADISFGVWLFDVRAGIGLSHRVTTPFYRGDPDLSDGIQIEDVQAVERVDRRKDWLPQVVAGADITIAYSEQDTITIGAEYFYNHAGISNPDLYPLLFIDGTFNPFYVGKHYAALFALLNAPGDWNDTSFSLSGIGDLSDRSFLARLVYQVRFFNYLNFSAYVNYHFGKNGALHLGYDIPPSDRPVPGVLENGLDFAAPLLEVGLAITVDL